METLTHIESPFLGLALLNKWTIHTSIPQYVENKNMKIPIRENGDTVYCRVMTKVAGR